MTQISIAVIGSCNIDVVVEAPKRPLAGETILGSRLIIAQGGKGANQAVAAARLGAKVYMVGCVGDDDYGRSVIKNFEANGVDTGNVKVVPGVTTGTAHITLAEGDNSIIVIKGANDLVTPELIDEAWPQNCRLRYGNAAARNSCCRHCPHLKKMCGSRSKSIAEPGACS